MEHFRPLHPHSSCDGAPSVNVSAAARRTDAGCIDLCFRLNGDLSGLRIPAATAPERCDELWRHTCAEAFVAAADGCAYSEFNFSPSGEWAAYRFDDYRRGMRAEQCEAPGIVTSSAAGELQIVVNCSLPAWLSVAPGLLLGITMVIEDSQGRCSYWALSHPGGKPDFHLRDGFVLEL